MLAVNASGRVGKYFRSIHSIINISPAHSRGKPSSFASGQKNHADRRETMNSNKKINNK